MANNRQKSNRGRKTLQRKELLLPEKMLIVQMIDMGHTHKEVAKKVGCCEQTVGYTMKNWVPTHPEEARVARAQATTALAQRFRGIAVDALGQVTKDSLTHDRVEIRDADGKLVGVQHSGPTGQQIMTAAGIAIDKALKLDETSERIMADGDVGDTASAKTVADLVASITKLSGKLKIEVDLSDVNQNESVEADYETIEDDTDPLQPSSSSGDSA